MCEKKNLPQPGAESLVGQLQKFALVIYMNGKGSAGAGWFVELFQHNIGIASLTRWLQSQYASLWMADVEGKRFWHYASFKE